MKEEESKLGRYHVVLLSLQTEISKRKPHSSVLDLLFLSLSSSSWKREKEKKEE
jgi:hypothetical protein